MGRSKIQTRADDDTKEVLKDYADDHNLTQSEAVRRVIRDGLSNKGYEIPTADGIGRVDEIEELRNEISEMEQRQVELAEIAKQREQRIKWHWATALSVGLAFVIASQLGTYPPLLIIGGGVIVLAAVVLTTYNAVTLLGDGDE